MALSRVEAARSAMLRRYRADGYILSAVSANIDADGTLRFVVIEGRIASVKLAGDIGPAGTQVLRFLNRLTEHRPIDSVTLERICCSRRTCRESRCTPCCSPRPKNRARSS